MRYVLGASVVIFVIVFTIAMIGGSPQTLMEYLDAPSLMPLIVIIGATVYMTGNYKTYTKAVNAILFANYKISQADKEKAIGLYKLLGKVVVYTTLITTMIGLVLTFGMDFALYTFGAMLAVSVIPIIYGAIINLVFIYPSIHILQNRENSETVNVISEKLVVDKLLELCYKKGVSPEEILEADDISFGGRN